MNSYNINRNSVCNALNLVSRVLSLRLGLPKQPEITEKM